jgi:GAF domain-containing protein
VGTCTEIDEQKRTREALRMLAEASVLIAGSLDYEETLARLARVAVPDLADWCAIDLAGADGLLRRVALAHRDPERVAFGEDLHRRFPPDPATDEGVYGVLRSGEPLFLPELPDELLEQGVEDPEHLRLLRAVGMRSVLLAPMAARGRTLGVLTLVTADSGRMLADGDVDLALDVARRAATAVDTAARFAGR